MRARSLQLALSLIAVAANTSAMAQFSSEHWERVEAVAERLQDDMRRAQELLLPKATDSPQQKANFDDVTWCSRVLGDVERETTFLRRLHKLRPHVDGQYGKDLMATYLQSQTRTTQSAISRGQQAVAKTKLATRNAGVGDLCGRAEAVLQSMQTGLREFAEK